MIELGNFDDNANMSEYMDKVKKLTGVSGGNWENQLRDEAGWVKPSKVADQVTVRQLQEFLQSAGFYAGKIDGICGYRTMSGIRLFQEYVRTVEEKQDIGFPDGRFGPKSQEHMQRWQQESRKADWALSGAAPSSEYAQWMALLEKVKEHYETSPSEVLKKVEAFPNSGDTVKKAEDWNFDPAKIHMVGIRHRKTDGSKQILDDVFVLLIRGMVFKFFGSTEPGTKVPEEPKFPFLVPGQHHYNFGWHHKNKPTTFKALIPYSGVIVQRSSNVIPTAAELAGPLDPRLNPSIHIHWSGGATESAGWSAGCQVISGKTYINHQNKLIDCSKFSASAPMSTQAYAKLGTKIDNVYQTKGAYSMLEDLVATFSGDGNAVEYMLVLEQDLDLHPDFGAGKAAKILEQLKSI